MHSSKYTLKYQKNLEFLKSKQKTTGIHQVQTSLNGAIIEPYRRNHNIPQSAKTIFTNETNHNKLQNAHEE